ncbi:GGDEF domain-containing protein [Undibacterium terreum]|uniref:diguanylate cyclase n=1 Tax=Undibacterium terreum TaxID=1224302 RepID=A0A916XPG4_9BURK|nr:diguanylate cyclase [Undibacterium terreum]GGC92876.1 GGDEF domain-containing protein [Undibacterium terreum]
MTTQLDRSNPATVLQANSGFENVFAEKFENRLKRFERLGLRLFSVANCMVNFINSPARFDKAERSMAALEVMFCESMPVPEDVVVVPDTRNDPALAENRLVVGAPYIRFYAAQPIWDHAQNLMGSVALIDYQPREFSDEDKHLLSDLAVMIERELALSTMYHAQLELIKQNRNLKRDSLIDPILGTWNKAAIVRSLRLEMDRCSKAEKPLSLIFASLDQSDVIRNTHGIAASDVIMVKIVSRIRSCIRPFDALGRFGNDVFLIVLPGASHLVATAVAERIRLAVMTHPDKIGDAQIALTITAGMISTDTFPNVEPETLISLAEKALLSAKSAGNNRVVQATPMQPDITI